MEARKLDNLSLEEYTALERTTGTKYEYHDGKVFAMAGGTLEHGLISGNAYGEIRGALREAGRDCTAINNEVKLYIDSMNKYLYPDAMAVCGPLERSKEEPNAIVNPTLIVEVLSSSTESYDRGDKFFFYRTLKTLKAYVLIAQYKPQVDLYTRTGDLWQISRVEGLSASLALAPLGISIPMQHLYEGVEWAN